MSALSASSSWSEHSLEVLEREQALAQHHDAVTGTSKWLVAENYAKRIFKGWDQAEQVLNEAFNSIVSKNNQSLLFPAQQHFCRRLNESACKSTAAGRNFAVTVFNGNSHSVDTLVRLPLYAASTHGGEWSEVGPWGVF